MNYHPLLVHFPIAFLSIYGLLELVRVRKIVALSYWFYLKGAFLIIGFFSVIPTYLSGRIIGDQFAENLVEVHSNFALATIIVFGILSVSYLISWIDKDYYSNVKNFDWWYIISKLNIKVFRPRTLLILAVIGLGLISTTGALGGIIAFGPDIDPITKIVNGMFFGK